MRKTLSIILLFCWCAASVSVASAHPRKESETDIQFNPYTQKTEIVHRFLIADAEEALQSEYGKGLDLIADQKVQLAFGFYVQDHFLISANGKKVEAQLIGAEIQGGAIWVYQESPSLSKDADYILRFNALMDTFPQQANIVNIRLYDQVQSFVLFRQAPWVTFGFDTSEAETP